MTSTPRRTLMVLLAAAAVARGEPAPDPEREAVRAYQAKDYPRFLAVMREVHAREPTLPRSIYNLASAQAVNGAAAEAVALLRQLAATGAAFAIDRDPDFAALRDRADFRAVARAMQANLAPRGRAEPAFTLRERELLAEGVAHDPDTRTTYVSSVRHRKIVAIDPAGRQRDFTPEAGDGVGGVFGLAVDRPRRALWAATTATPHMIGYRPDDQHAAAVVAYELATGKLIARYPVPRDGRPHVLGDVAVSSAGDAYATDSLSPTIYRVDAARGALEVVVEGGFRSLQGLALSSDDRTLYVADYARGLYAVDLATKAVTRLELAPQIAATGIDGLYLHRGRLIATQNGLTPARVLALTLDPTGRKLVGQAILLSGDPRAADLALGAVVGDALYLNAASGWAHYTDDGAPRADHRAAPHLILKVPLR